MSPTHEQLLEQLSRLRESPLADGFEAALHERLVAVSQQAGAVVVPFRRSSRRKVTLVLVAALSVPLAAAAASGVFSRYWHRRPAENAQTATGPAQAQAAAPRKATGRPVVAPAVPSAPPESAVEPGPNSASTSEARPAASGPARARRATSVATVRSGPNSLPSKESIAPETAEARVKAASDAQPASGATQPASAPLEQLDLSWPGGSSAQRTGTKGTPSSPSAASSSTASPATPSSVTPATSGLRRAGQDQSAGEQSRANQRERHGRTEAGRSGSGSDRARRGGAAQQRQMNPMKRGQ
jgi:hypothetical protein